ncbi:MAG: tRNA 2-thiouridine(34) synthase MnmA, partial [Spirochaetales bacterium]|nr:tRNA 2-thiouridine(34) synthase MnmA [Spirochaetales bacterium]
HRLSVAQLARSMFPLGVLSKAQVRAEASRLGLAVADKEESQDFMAGGYDVLFGDDAPGDIVDEAGTVIGKHRGIVHYTIGQRRGIGVSTGPKPLYVSAIDARANRIVVSDNDALFCQTILGDEVILHDGTLSTGDFVAYVRIRQNHHPAKATVRVQGSSARIEFETPQRAAAPGQAAAFYDADGFALGGCYITGSERPSGVSPNA